MKIHEYFYNENTKILYLEFSTKEDSDVYYRILELTYGDVEFYYPEIIEESDLLKINKKFINELLEEYFKENEMPQQQLL